MAPVSDDGKDADRQWPSGLEREPPLGAHLTTSRRGYSHHGVYVGRGRVVHDSGLSGFWQCGPVEEASLPRFAWCLSGISDSAQVQRPLWLPFRVLGALFHS